MNGWYVVGGLGIVGVTLAFVWLSGQVKNWKTMFYEKADAFDDVLNRALNAEADKTRAEEQLETFRNFMNTITKQPLIATLTDQQASQLVHSITSYLNETFNPSKLKN